jgi:hypothetical protein
VPLADARQRRAGYASGAYWRGRQHLLYYQAVRQIVDFLGTPEASVIDVGSGNSPYLEWFDWAGERVSVDINVPYRSAKVAGLQADILTHTFPQTFHICMCLQVLEHIPEPKQFAQRLFEIGQIVVISVPFQWPAGLVKGHLHDPVDKSKLQRWTGRRPNYEFLVEEPLRERCASRLISVYDHQARHAGLRAFTRKGQKP